MVDVLKILKLNKATGPDGISNRMLKLTHSTVSYPLAKLFNSSLKTHTYPDLWKIAHVMPLFKKGKSRFVVTINQFHYQAMLASLSNELFSSICTITFFENELSGLLPCHSIVHHLIEFVQNTCMSLENHEASCQLFCDIFKAFDRVWHRGLIHKLEKCGIKGDIFNMY